MMLLIAATAVWTAYYTGRESIERDTVAIESMHGLAPELHIRNQQEYACLQIDRMDDVREYQCYLPPGHEYNLHLQWSQEFKLNDNSWYPEASVTLAAGKHQILMNEMPDKLVVSVDGAEVIDVPRKMPKSRSTGSTGVGYGFQSQWYPMDQSLTLLRLRESDNGTISDEGPGIALWIEPKK